MEHSADFKIVDIWFRCLLVGLWGLVLFSLGMIFWPEGTHLLFDIIAFKGSPPPSLLEPEVRNYLGFVYGVMGAIMLGWAGTLLYITKGPLRQGKKWAWYAIAVPLSIWFIADTTHSLVSGFWQNAFFNLAFYIFLGVPLLFLRNTSSRS